VLFPADEVMEYADGNADVRAQVSQRSETIWPMSGVTGDHDCMSYNLDYNKLLLHAADYKCTCSNPPCRKKASLYIRRDASPPYCSLMIQFSQPHEKCVFMMYTLGPKHHHRMHHAPERSMQLLLWSHLDTEAVVREGLLFTRGSTAVFSLHSSLDFDTQSSLRGCGKGLPLYIGPRSTW